MKITSAILMLSCITMTSLSQKVNYGLLVGGNSAKWSGDVDIFIEQLESGMNFQSGFSGFSFNNSARLGFSVGGFLEFAVTNHLLIRSELAYVQKGARFVGSGTILGQNVDMKLIMLNDYVELPLLIKLSLTKNEKLLNPYLIAGPSIGYKTLSKLKVTAKAGGESDSETEDFEGLKELNYGLNVGGGIKFKEVSIELRYQKGLSPILSNNASDGLDIKSGFISINLLISMY